MTAAEVARQAGHARVADTIAEASGGRQLQALKDALEVGSLSIQEIEKNIYDQVPSHPTSLHMFFECVKCHWL
jgi:hypothetical protein